MKAAALEIVPQVTSTEILTAYHEVQDAAKDAVYKAGMAVRKAVECGHKLIAAREERRGTFTAWIEQELKEIGTATAYRWIKLAESPESLWRDAVSLRQAYIAVGLLPEPEPLNPGGDNQRPAGNYLVHIARAERALSIQISDIRHMPKPERKLLKERLAPLVEIWRAL